MNEDTDMGNSPGIPVQEGPNQTPSPGERNEAIPLPPPGISIPAPNVPSPPEERTRTTTPSGLRDFEGRRLYFANVCATVTLYALHCIFRSYGPIRSFHYDTALHYGYVVYLERQHALLARYGVDGLILGSKAIKVYYPPFKPRNPTRYCYNCREMGHFIQNCPYSNSNNWEYNYAQLYNQGQPVVDNLIHPSTPMMGHFSGHGHTMPPTSQFMYPTSPVSNILGQQAAGSATLTYQPGWSGNHPPGPSVQFMPSFMGSQHHQIHYNQPQQPIRNPPSLIPVHQQVNPVPPLIINNPEQQPSAPSMAPTFMQPSPSYSQQPQLRLNINTIIQEQATAVIQQNVNAMVQQVVSQIMQDPAISSLQQSMMQHQNMDPPGGRPPTSYTVNEDPESGSLQSGSMSMHHGSYIEEPRTPASPQNILAQLMQNLPTQDSESEFVDLGKMMQFAAQTLLQDQCGQRNAREGCSRSRCVHEMEEEMSYRDRSPIPPPVTCCPVHNTPMTRVQKPSTSAQQSSPTKTPVMHNGPTTTPRPQQFIPDHVAPLEQDSSSTESIRLNTTEPQMQSSENQYDPQYQPPFSLPSSIYFTLPPIVVNITSPAPYSPSASSAAEPKATYTPPRQRNLAENYDFMQESERTIREFEEVVRDDEQNYVENERDLRAQQSTMLAAQTSGGAGAQETQNNSPLPKSPPKASPSKIQLGERSMKNLQVNEQTNEPEDPTMEYEPTPLVSEKERQRQYRLKLRAMVMDGSEQDLPVKDSPPVNSNNQLDEGPAGQNQLIYSDLISTVNTSCNQLENLFTNLSSLVGNPLATKCLDQIRTKSEADIMKLSQELLQKIANKEKPSDKEEILKLSNDLLNYANEQTNEPEDPIMEYVPTPIVSEQERRRQYLMKLHAMVMDGSEQDHPVEDIPPVNSNNQLNEEPAGQNNSIYSELISTMNTSCSEIENLFSNLSSLVGNPLAKKCLDQIRTKSEADMLKLSQQLIHQSAEADKPSDKGEILKLSNDLLNYANESLPSTSADADCEGAVGGGPRNEEEETVESSRSECDLQKADSDDGNYRRKNHGKKYKKRRR